MKGSDWELLDRWRHGRLSGEEFAGLQSRLHSEPELRAALRELADLEEGLCALALSRSLDPAPERQECAQSASGKLPLAPQAWLPWSVTAAALAIAALSWWKPQDAGDARPAPSRAERATAKPPREVTALLVDAADAVFADPRRPGEVRFDPGAYELRSGTVHLRFVNGADLVVEGPARFNIRDPFRTELLTGRVRAIVPPTAHGFTVLTRGVAYEDVGTEFGLSMNEATGESLMHVFDGQVNLRTRNASGPLLRSAFLGESVGFREGHIYSVTSTEVGGFPSPENIGHLRWNSERNRQLADDGLIAWFPFERDGNPSRLANALDRKEVSDGMIDGPRWSTGRWPGKEALCFDNHNDFVEFEIPGEHSELSVAAWIKVDRFEHEMSAILNSDGDAFGGLHFQMNRLGLPRGGMLGVGRPAQRWVGNPVPKGKWVHIVSVLSLEQRSHVIYVNAQPVLQTELASTNLKIRPGRCRLGNWQEPSRSPDHSPLLTRPLSGVVDELSIWNRALSAAEIAALTERGRPSLLWTRENPPLKVPMPRL